MQLNRDYIRKNSIYHHAERKTFDVSIGFCVVAYSAYFYYMRYPINRYNNEILKN